MQKILPCLWFDTQAEEAANFYTSLFDESKITNTNYYGEAGPRPAGTVLTVNFSLAGQEFMALNGGPEYKFTPAISFFVNCATEAELDRLFEKLSQGGRIYMELGAYPFSKKFAWVGDRFGLTWQLNLAPRPQKIDPFLMYVGEQHGKALEATEFYASLFEEARILADERLPAEAESPESTARRVTLVLAGQEFMALDGGRAHPFTFSPALSLYVSCDTQAEVDRLWDRLTLGGKQIQCGWLEDRFGVTWQIVPAILEKLLQDPDAEKANRVMLAMLKMVKLDIAALQQAYEASA